MIHYPYGLYPVRLRPSILPLSHGPSSPSPPQPHIDSLSSQYDMHFPPCLGTLVPIWGMDLPWLQRGGLKSRKALGELSFYEESERERGFETPAACLEGISL
jgi:hypothetical protein